MGYVKNMKAINFFTDTGFKKRPPDSIHTIRNNTITVSNFYTKYPETKKKNTDLP